MCNHCHSLVDFALSGCGKTWSETTEEGFTLQCLGCWKVDCLTAELARLTDIVKGLESGGRVIARKTNGEKRRGYSEAVIKGALRTEKLHYDASQMPFMWALLRV